MKCNFSPANLIALYFTANNEQTTVSFKKLKSFMETLSMQCNSLRFNLSEKALQGDKYLYSDVYKVNQKNEEITLKNRGNLEFLLAPLFPKHCTLMIKEQPVNVFLKMPKIFQ